jgi:hypothetical protein
MSARGKFWSYTESHTVWRTPNKTEVILKGDCGWSISSLKTQILWMIRNEGLGLGSYALP